MAPYLNSVETVETINVSQEYCSPPSSSHVPPSNVQVVDSYNEQAQSPFDSDPMSHMGGPVQPPKSLDVIVDSYDASAQDKTDGREADTRECASVETIHGRKIPSASIPNGGDESSQVADHISTTTRSGRSKLKAITRRTSYGTHEPQNDVYAFPPDSKTSNARLKMNMGTAEPSNKVLQGFKVLRPDNTVIIVPSETLAAADASARSDGLGAQSRKRKSPDHDLSALIAEPSKRGSRMPVTKVGKASRASKERSSVPEKVNASPIAIERRVLRSTARACVTKSPTNNLAVGSLSSDQLRSDRAREAASKDREIETYAPPKPIYTSTPQPTGKLRPVKRKQNIAAAALRPGIQITPTTRNVSTVAVLSSEDTIPSKNAKTIGTLPHSIRIPHQAAQEKDGFEVPVSSPGNSGRRLSQQPHDDQEYIPSTQAERAVTRVHNSKLASHRSKPMSSRPARDTKKVSGVSMCQNKQAVTHNDPAAGCRASTLASSVSNRTGIDNALEVSGSVESDQLQSGASQHQPMYISDDERLSSSASPPAGKSNVPLLDVDRPMLTGHLQKPQTPAAIASSPPSVVALTGDKTRKSAIISFSKYGPRNQGLESNLTAVPRPLSALRDAFSSTRVPLALEVAKQKGPSSVATSIRTTKSSARAPPSNVASNVEDALVSLLGPTTRPSRNDAECLTGRGLADNDESNVSGTVATISDLEAVQPNSTTEMQPDPVISAVPDTHVRPSTTLSGQTPLPVSPLNEAGDLEGVTLVASKTWSPGRPKYGAMLSESQKEMPPPFFHTPRLPLPADQANDFAKPREVNDTPMQSLPGTKRPATPELSIERLVKHKVTSGKPARETYMEGRHSSPHGAEPPHERKHQTASILHVVAQPLPSVTTVNTTKEFQAQGEHQNKASYLMTSGHSARGKQKNSDALSTRAATKPTRKVSQVSQTVDMLGSPVPRHMDVPANLTALEVYALDVEVSSEDDTERDCAIDRGDTQFSEGTKLVEPGSPMVLISAEAGKLSSNRKSQPDHPQAQAKVMFQVGELRSGAVLGSQNIASAMDDPFTTIMKTSAPHKQSRFLAKFADPPRTVATAHDHTPGPVLKSQEGARPEVSHHAMHNFTTSSRGTPVSRMSSQGSRPDPEAMDLLTWRNALEPHQLNFFDELVNISHRLTQHVMDEEDATGQIVQDYRKRGVQIIEQMELAHAQRYQQHAASLEKKRKQMRRALRTKQKELNESMTVFAAAREEHNQWMAARREEDRELEDLLDRLS